jgi:hypothetical protein
VPRSIRAHFEHHKRFYAAAALGILIWTVTWMFALPVHLAVAGDAFFLVYLLSMLGMAHRATPSEMRTRAAVKDEGIVLIVLITLAAIGLSLGSIFALLNEPEKPDTGRLVLSVWAQARPGRSESAKTQAKLFIIGIQRRAAPFEITTMAGMKAASTIRNTVPSNYVQRHVSCKLPSASWRSTQRSRVIYRNDPLGQHPSRERPTSS